MWELPVLLPLKNERGDYCCDILLLCACQVETYYFLGKFDYDKNKFYKFHDKPQLIDIGNGTFTGPSGFVTPDGRSVVFTIAQGKRKPDDEYNSGWAHNGGMPVELSIKENELRVEPIKEVRKYFTDCLFSQEIGSDELNRPVLLGDNLLQNRVFVTTQGDYLELCMEWKDDAYIVSYHRTTKEWKAISRLSGKMIGKIRDEQDLVDIGQEEVRIECFVDHSMLEFYLNGKKSISLRSYPFCEGNQCFVKMDGIGNVSVWEYEKNANSFLT